MTNPIYLALVFHNHQPVGNFDFVNEHSYNVAYLPLVELLENHPRVNAALHFTGSLLKWMTDSHPDLVKRIRALVARGQVEILTGGYYEPILAALPDADKRGQIGKLTTAVQESFGAAPQGVWLAERVWEPHLAKPLAEAGGRYVIVDDAHFEAVGFDKDRDLFGYFITEEQGHSLAVFPTLTHLRYAIPWLPVHAVIDWLHAQAQTQLESLQPKLAFMADDGEKFGVWPGTWEHCWENGYMEALFTALEQNADWLHTITPAAFMEAYPALGRAYLPTASYMELGEWALPAGPSSELASLRQDLQDEGNRKLLRFLRGGIWRNFMVKYDEINHMHKRSLQVSRAVHAMPDGPDKDRALDFLWSAQSNDAYWHGLFGGIYLFHFRVENYANLIEAEMLANGGKPPLSVTRFDLDMDGHEDVVLSSESFYMVWDLSQGGALREWDYRPARYNLLNLMTRRDEGYHQDLLAALAEGRYLVVDEDSDVEFDPAHRDIVRVKEPNIGQYLIADWYRRGSFIDHFLREDATLEGFYRSAYPEQGDYVILPYDAEAAVEADGAEVRLRRSGHVWIGEDHLPVDVVKQFRVEDGSDRLTVKYIVSNRASRSIDVRFAIETALAFDGGDNPAYCTFETEGAQGSLGDVAAHEDISSYRATTNLRHLATEVKLSIPAVVWRFPLETVTLSEAGFERGHQGTVFLQWWPLHLEAGQAWEMTMTLDIQRLG